MENYPLCINTLIERLEQIRNEQGNLMVVLVGEYKDVHLLRGNDLQVGYNDCQEFKFDKPEDLTEELEPVLGILL